MRTEQEMYDLIINTAKADERIRAVYMNGSRTNVNAPKDIFQDYDIVYAVTGTRPFYEDKSWIDRFGERLYMQCPDECDRSVGLEVDFEKCYGWLIQFADGNRLDLHVEALNKLDILDDKLCRILLDKDGILPNIPEATDIDFHVKKPSEAEYLAACNEFWWCLNNVAKGLWRNELPFAHDMLNGVVRPQLVKIMSWKIGNETDFSVSVGKSAKYMYRWLKPTAWERFLQTYGGTTAEQVWNSVMIMCGLMDEIAPGVGEKLGFQYNYTEAKNSRYYLEHVRNLPADAAQIF